LKEEQRRLLAERKKKKPVGHEESIVCVAL
jgi:hypothetical protein